MTDNKHTTTFYAVIIVTMFVWGVSRPSEETLSLHGAVADTVFTEVANIITYTDTTFCINVTYNGAISTALTTTAYLYSTSSLGAEKASSCILPYCCGVMGLCGTYRSDIAPHYLWKYRSHIFCIHH